MSIDPQDSWPDRETAELSNPFIADNAEVGGSLEDLDALAAVEAARQEEIDKLDAAASEAVDKLIEDVKRPQPWQENATWDGDTSFTEGLRMLGGLLGETEGLIGGWDELVERGGLDPETSVRDNIKLSLVDRIFIYAGLQALGIVSGQRYRTRLDHILNYLIELAEPTPEEDARFMAAQNAVEAAWESELAEEVARRRAAAEAAAEGHDDEPNDNLHDASWN